MYLDLRNLAGVLTLRAFDHREMDDNERWHTKLLVDAGISQSPADRFDDYMVVLEYFSCDPELRRPMGWAEFSQLFRDPDACEWLSCIDNPMEFLMLLSEKAHSGEHPVDKHPVELVAMLIKELQSHDFFEQTN